MTSPAQPSKPNRPRRSAAASPFELRPPVPRPQPVPAKAPAVPRPAPAPPLSAPPPLRPRRAPVPFGQLLSCILRAGVIGLLLLGIFITGMEVGYRRANRRWEEALRTKGTVPAEIDAAVLAKPAQPAPALAPSNQPGGQAQVAVAPPPPKAPPVVAAPNPAAVAASLVRFDSHIRPLFQAKCTTCHGEVSKKGRLDLRTVAALVKGGSSGPAIRVGDARASVLWEYVADDRMPPGKGKLSAAEKLLVKNWIDGGGR